MTVSLRIISLRGSAALINESDSKLASVNVCLRSAAVPVTDHNSRWIERSAVCCPESPKLGIVNHNDAILALREHMALHRTLLPPCAVEQFDFCQNCPQI
jgi:hypothetical protein